MPFHTRTLDLLGLAYRPGRGASDVLDRLELELGIHLPGAVREWYALEEAVEILAEHSNMDQAIPVEELGRSDQDRRFVCTWAVWLGDEDDPPVLVLDRSPITAEWKIYAEHFSTFVYTQVWDWPTGRCFLEAQDCPLEESDLAFLRRELAEAPRTYAWPAAVTYRFQAADAKVRIWDDQTRQAGWWLWSEDGAALLRLARRIQHRGRLAHSLDAWDTCGRAVLEALRREERGRPG